MSNIEWTDETWNPTTGCTKISPGCKNCYALAMSKRLKGMGSPKYQNGKDGFDLTIHPNALSIPIDWKKPKMIFVNSMSDLFHKDVPLWFITEVVDVCITAHWHKFQILTKRSSRLLELNDKIIWPDNVWMGVSIETSEYRYRIDNLRKTHAKVKFLSIEPLIGPLYHLDLSGIDWVIVGGESGPNSRPMNVDWVRRIRDQCLEQDVPFFFKQWGGKNKKKSGRVLDGMTWDQYPI